VVRAAGVGVELEHAARRVHRSRDGALCGELLRLAQVDKEHLASGELGGDLVRRQILDTQSIIGFGPAGPAA
jgi:hypothetical protein